MEDFTDAASAYLAWWDMAGVDCAAVETPTDWLKPAPASQPLLQTSVSAPVAKPASLIDFTQWLAQDGDQPERRWPGVPILPAGTAGSALMVITDMPDPADMEAGTLLTDAAGRLFDAMLTVVGLSRQDVYLASLFCARPPGGMVEAADLSAAADRMRTHVSLAAPGRLLILGDRTVRALFPDQESRGMDNLHFVNHDGGIVPALASFHPRLLLGQPAAKAECWRTLQRLIEEMHQ